MDAMRMVRVAAAVALVGCFAVASADTGYGDYLDWLGWARYAPGVRAGLASSYDRDGGNLDFSFYEWPDYQPLDDRTVIAKTIQGPGIIYRFWMPHLTSNRVFDVRLYFDGETSPRIDTTSDVLLAGLYSYMEAPLVDTAAGGQVCYEPIPFQHSLVIETNNRELPDKGWSPNRHYYQYTYATFPPGTPVESFDGTLTPEQQDQRNAVAQMFLDAGQHPAGASGTAIRVPTGSTVLPAEGRLTLADLAGPGVVRQVSVAMDTATDDELSGLRLEVRYDGDDAAAIDVAIARFFGAGRQRAPFRSLVIGTDSTDGFYCYWPMPFAEAVEVVLFNTTDSAISIDSAVVEYEPAPIDDNMAYLHARESTEVKQPGQVYHNILSVSGRGHYVGNLLYLDQPSFSFYMLEGDEVITVDGSDVMYGTGLEDAYNGGYYYNWVGVQGDEPEGPMPQHAHRPLSGILYVDRTADPARARADQYRWYVADRVGFSSSIEVNIECGYSVTGAQWTSVAFWYQLPPISGDFDGDFDLDVRDFAAFQTCYSDPTPECLAVFDENGDGMTLPDFAHFQQRLTGPLPTE